MRFRRFGFRRISRQMATYVPIPTIYLSCRACCSIRLSANGQNDGPHPSLQLMHAVREMIVDRREGWQNRLWHAEEMFQSIAGVPAAEWLPDGWQRERPLVMLWDNKSAFAKRILRLCETWMRTKTFPGALTAILSKSAGPATIESAMEADRLHLGHCGHQSLNRKQRDAVRAVRLLNEGQVQAVNGPPRYR
jgi:hypothetical protein